MSVRWIADLTAPVAAIHSKVLVASFPEQNVNSVRSDDYFWLQDVTRRAPSCPPSLLRAMQSVASSWQAGQVGVMN